MPSFCSLSLSKLLVSFLQVLRWYICCLPVGHSLQLMLALVLTPCLRKEPLKTSHPISSRDLVHLRYTIWCRSARIGNAVYTLSAPVINIGCHTGACAAAWYGIEIGQLVYLSAGGWLQRDIFNFIFMFSHLKLGRQKCLDQGAWVKSDKKEPSPSNWFWMEWEKWVWACCRGWCKF